jgi:hypothetical protein
VPENYYTHPIDRHIDCSRSLPQQTRFNAPQACDVRRSGAAMSATACATDDQQRATAKGGRAQRATARARTLSGGGRLARAKRTVYQFMGGLIEIRDLKSGEIVNYASSSTLTSLLRR